MKWLRTASLLVSTLLGPGLLAIARPTPAQEAPALPGASPPAATAPAFVIGAPKGQPLSGPALKARVEEVTSLLRCPVCQGLSVADSPATMALNMKVQVGEMLAVGYDQEQILTYFERSYGEFVRLEPKMRGANWLVWLGPLGALVAGAAVVTWALKRSSRNAALGEGTEVAPPVAVTTDLPSRDTLPDDPRLATAVRQMRELAYGWPGGTPPEAPSSAS